MQFNFRFASADTFSIRIFFGLLSAFLTFYSSTSLQMMNRGERSFPVWLRIPFTRSSQQTVNYLFYFSVVLCAAAAIFPRSRKVRLLACALFLLCVYADFIANGTWIGVWLALGSALILSISDTDFVQASTESLCPFRLIFFAICIYDVHYAFANETGLASSYWTFRIGFTLVLVAFAVIKREGYRIGALCFLAAYLCDFFMFGRIDPALVPSLVPLIMLKLKVPEYGV